MAVAHFVTRFESFPMKKAALLAPLAAAVALSACAVTPEARVRTGLMNAGLSPRMSDCMAPRMVDRLSIAQLRRLSAVAHVKESDLHRLSLDELLYKIRALQDPEIFTVTSKAALVCALDS